MPGGENGLNGDSNQTVSLHNTTLSNANMNGTISLKNIENMNVTSFFNVTKAAANSSLCNDTFASNAGNAANETCNSDTSNANTKKRKKPTPKPKSVSNLLTQTDKMKFDMPEFGEDETGHFTVTLTTGRDCLWDCFSEKGEGNGMFFNEKIFKSKLGRERQNRLTKLLVKRKDYDHRVEDE